MKRVRPWRLGERCREPREALGVLGEVAEALAVHLRAALRAEITVRALEPRIIPPDALAMLLDASTVFGWSGQRTDLATVIDVRSAQACAAAALGGAEPPRGGSLSPLEREVVARVISAALPAFRPLCGPIRGAATANPAPGDLFLEFTIGPMPAASLAVAVPPPPMSLPGPPLEVESLAEVPMTLSVEFARASIAFAELASLSVGDVVIFDTRFGDPAVLRVGGEAAFIGHPGVQAGRAAFAVGETLSRKVE